MGPSVGDPHEVPFQAQGVAIQPLQYKEDDSRKGFPNPAHLCLRL